MLGFPEEFLFHQLYQRLYCKGVTSQLGHFQEMSEEWSYHKPWMGSKEWLAAAQLTAVSTGNSEPEVAALAYLTSAEKRNRG